MKKSEDVSCLMRLLFCEICFMMLSMDVRSHNVNAVLLRLPEKRSLKGTAVLSSVFKINTNKNETKSKSSLYPIASLASTVSVPLHSKTSWNT